MGADPEQTPGPRKHRVLVVDDEPLVRFAVDLVFGGDPDFAVCAHAASAEEALTAARAGGPFDLVVLDHELRGSRTGMQVAGELRAACAGARLILFSASACSHEIDHSLFDAAVDKSDPEGLVMRARELLGPARRSSVTDQPPPAPVDLFEPRARPARRRLRPAQLPVWAGVAAALALVLALSGGLPEPAQRLVARLAGLPAADDSNRPPVDGSSGPSPSTAAGGPEGGSGPAPADGQLPGGAATEGAAAAPGRAGSVDARSLADLLNAARRAEGLPALAWDPPVARSAQEWARQIAARGLVRPRDAVELAEALRPPWERVGEVVGTGEDPAGALAGVLASSEQRTELLHAGYHRAGVGVAPAGNGFAVVVTLVGRADREPSARGPQGQDPRPGGQSPANPGGQAPGTPGAGDQQGRRFPPPAEPEPQSPSEAPGRPAEPGGGGAGTPEPSSGADQPAPGRGQGGERSPRRY